MKFTTNRCNKLQVKTDEDLAKVPRLWWITKSWWMCICDDFTQLALQGQAMPMPTQMNLVFTSAADENPHWIFIVLFTPDEWSKRVRPPSKGHQKNTRFLEEMEKTREYQKKRNSPGWFWCVLRVAGRRWMYLSHVTVVVVIVTNRLWCFRSSLNWPLPAHSVQLNTKVAPICDGNRNVLQVKMSWNIWDILWWESNGLQEKTSPVDTPPDLLPPSLTCHPPPARHGTRQRYLGLCGQISGFLVYWDVQLVFVSHVTCPCPSRGTWDKVVGELHNCGNWFTDNPGLVVGNHSSSWASQCKACMSVRMQLKAGCVQVRRLFLRHQCTKG